MKDLLMTKGARTLVDACTKVKPGETVLIVTDLHKIDIGKAIAGVAMDRDAEVIITIIQSAKYYLTHCQNNCASEKKPNLELPATNNQSLTTIRKN